jgi:hypothetical protein
MKNYNSIIKGFTKTIKKLEKLATLNADAVANNNNVIADLKWSNDALNAEGAMAATTARKLSELIGG